MTRIVFACAALVSVGLTPQELDRSFVSTLIGRHKPSSIAFQFALIGDQQYSVEQEARFPAVIRAMDREPLAFIVHDGDFKGGQRCTDELYRNRFALFDSSRHPFVFTPGDNDWTDCHSDTWGGYDPLERLATLRRMFYPAAGTSLGRRKLALSSQSTQPGFRPFVENVVWSVGDVVFATFHQVGSGNGIGRSADGDQEAAVRTRANVAWIKTAFALARGGAFRAVMLITQANPRFELDPADAARQAFAETTTLIESETRAFQGEVVLVHGDSHYFRIDKPLRMPSVARASGRPVLTNFTRVETFGPPDLHWIRVRVTPGNRGVFVFEPQIIPLPKNQ